MVLKLSRVVLFDVLESAQCTLYGEKIVTQNVNLQKVMCHPEQGIHQHHYSLINQRSIDLIG